MKVGVVMMIVVQPMLYRSIKSLISAYDFYVHGMKIHAQFNV